jgi:malate dehydrogenase (oxaloacetate-decarboxylating)
MKPDRASGRRMLRNRYLNKGTAFSPSERDRFGLHGLIPPVVETLDLQLERTRVEYDALADDLARHIFLRLLQQRNSVLFYRFVIDHLEELLPILYTPTVGIACQRWSRIYRREHGLYVSWPLLDRIDELIGNAVDASLGDQEVDVIVATDGERVLGLGDLGVGGMGIPIGKLSLYTAVGGIDPARTLPVVLDVGTDNESLLSDPLYLGWRHRRLRDERYDELVDAFVDVVHRRFPHAVLQWEDFAQANATRLLERHRDRICSFNDDIQGTAAITTAAVMAGMRATRTPLADLRFVIVGAGSAGTGIARQIIRALESAGVGGNEAARRCWLVDRAGLLHEDSDELLEIHTGLVRPRHELTEAGGGAGASIGLRETIERVVPHALIGVSGQPGLFDEASIRAMASAVEHPIVLPLSNPTPRAEATPAEVLAWTDGRALVGTGSPFQPVTHGGRTITVSQVNNVHIFPGVGMGALAVGARRITDSMLTVAADTVSAMSPAAAGGPGEPLLPPVSASRATSRAVAVAVATAAVEEGNATVDHDQIGARIESLLWEPDYRPLA